MDERISVIIQNYLLAEMHLKPGFKPDNPSTRWSFKILLFISATPNHRDSSNTSAFDKNPIALASS
jgi:hypothetical protein